MQIKHDPDIDIRARLDSLQQLPSLDTNVMQISQKVVSEKAEEIDIDEIISIIEKDIGLSAKVFQVANSAQYAGRYARFGTLRQAVVRLGIPELIRICLAIAAIQRFQKTTPPSIDMKGFWLHSLCVAKGSAKVAMHAQNVTFDTSRLYIAGLFHDIGSVILDTWFTELYQDINRQARTQHEYLHVVEKEILGMDHGEISAYLLRRWGLDENIIEAAGNHHHPQHAPVDQRAPTQLLHVTDFACSALGAFEPGERQPQNCDVAVWEDLGISEDAMDAIIAETKDQIEVGGEFISMAL